jgi:hypothetical protein
MTCAGDIQNVFNNGGPKGAAAGAIVAAIGAGGRTLDCFDGFLPSYYHQFGFEETGRMKFNPEFAPPGWNPKDGTPDVVFMAWKGYPAGGAQGAIERASSRSEWLSHSQSSDYTTDFDGAKEASRKGAKV